MKASVLCLCLAFFSRTTWAAPQPDARPQARYSGGGNQDGDSIANGNDGGIGQLSGFFNALVSELQHAPSLANGPQAKGVKITDISLTTSASIPAESEGHAAPVDIPARSSFNTNNDNHVGSTNNLGGGFNDFNNNNNNEPSFNGGQEPFGGGQAGPFGGGPEPFGGGPGGQSPFGGGPGGPGPFGGGPGGPGPFGGGPGGPGPFGGGPGGPFGGGSMGSGPYNNDGYNNYNDQPPPTKKPSPNDASYGSDNTQLQDMGMGQLGKFFSSMVGELQNTGFDNGAPTKASVKLVKKIPTTTAATTIDA